MAESSLRNRIERTHGKILTNICRVYVGGGGGRDVCDVIPTHPKIGGITGGGVTRKSTHSG